MTGGQLFFKFFFSHDQTVRGPAFSVILSPGKLFSSSFTGNFQTLFPIPSAKLSPFIFNEEKSPSSRHLQEKLPSDILDDEYKPCFSC